MESWIGLAPTTFKLPKTFVSDLRDVKNTADKDQIVRYSRQVGGRERDRERDRRQREETIFH